jgi:hypothetical protein
MCWTEAADLPSVAQAEDQKRADQNSTGIDRHVQQSERQEQPGGWRQEHVEREGAEQLILASASSPVDHERVCIAGV